jgi:glycerol uptake facilitator-like aquaporin
VLNYLKSLGTRSPDQYAFAAGAFAKVVLTFMCMIVILAVADNASKKDLPISVAVPDGLLDSVLSESAATEPWPRACCWIGEG